MKQKLTRWKKALTIAKQVLLALIAIRNPEAERIVSEKIEKINEILTE